MAAKKKTITPRNLVALQMILQPSNAARKEVNDKVKAAREACRKPITQDD